MFEDIRIFLDEKRITYTYEIIDDFFINSKDSYYLSEYISGIYQVNQEKIVNKLINNNDKIFIKQLLDDNILQDVLDDKYRQLLINAINNLMFW